MEKITFSEKSLDFIKNLYSENSISNDYFFRIKCDGAIGAPFTYNFAFDKKKNDDDTVLQFDDLNVIIDSKSFSNMEGSSVDYDNEKQNLKFNNPLQTYKCSGHCHTKRK